MRRPFTRPVTVLVASALAMAATLARSDPPPGRLLAAQCAQCHGTDGYSVSDIESLAGKPASEIYDEMVELRTGAVESIMHLQARGYSDEQLHLIADYFASLPEDPPARP